MFVESTPGLRRMRRTFAAVACLAPLGGADCPAQAAPKWVLAIHGGAGALPKDLSASDVGSIRDAMRRALEAGGRVLEPGGSSLDAVQAAVKVMESSAPEVVVEVPEGSRH
jgi:beta-aspartyl-peptidase (threonine type)